MYQAELFTTMAKKHGEYLGSGLYANVYKMTDGTVCKIGENDGTRNWLELCAIHTANGTLLPMMPEVFGVVALEDDKYMAFMPCYEGMEGCNLYTEVYEHAGYRASKYLFQEYLEMISGHAVKDDHTFNDIHQGNVMRCPKRGVIITDPCASDYAVQWAKPEFLLN